LICLFLVIHFWSWMGLAGNTGYCIT